MSLMNSRKSISEHLIELLGGKCKVCGSIEDLEVEHIEALCLDGEDTAKNLQVLCKKCHKVKTAKSSHNNNRSFLYLKVTINNC